MSGNKNKRLAKLERKRQPAGETFMVWRDRAKGWTQEEALARRFPDGVPPGAKIIMFSWMLPGESKAEAQEWLRAEQAKP
jgi:hypothetical protein